MDYQAFRDRLFALAQENGCSDAETYRQEDVAFSVGVLDQRIDSYTVSRAGGVGLRVQVNGRDGYAYTESMDQAEELVRRAMDNARCMETSDEHPMQVPLPCPPVTPPADPLSSLDENAKIELAMQLERLVLAHGDPVVKSAKNVLETTRRTVMIHNTRGLDLTASSDHSFVYANAVVKQGDEVRDAYGFGSATAAMAPLAAEAVAKARAKLGATSVPPGTYRVLFQQEAAARLLAAFAPAFSAERVQKGLSCLAGREGQQIAAAIVQLHDDPLHAIQPRAFDAEGTPAQRTQLLADGVLRSFLHNLKTAKKAGVATTANGGRSSAAAPVGVAPSNLFLAPGRTAYADLVAQLDDGLIITDLAGTHAGVNPVAGDFSLLAAGFRVQGGQIAHPVEQITIAGTLLSLLEQVVAIGDDLYFGLPGNSRIGSPSFLVTALPVAGR